MPEPDAPQRVSLERFDLAACVSQLADRAAGKTRSRQLDPAILFVHQRERTVWPVLGLFRTGDGELIEAPAFENEPVLHLGMAGEGPIPNFDNLQLASVAALMEPAVPDGAETFDRMYVFMAAPDAPALGLTRGQPLCGAVTVSGELASLSIVSGGRLVMVVPVPSTLIAPAALWAMPWWAKILCLILLFAVVVGALLSQNPWWILFAIIAFLIYFLVMCLEIRAQWTGGGGGGGGAGPGGGGAGADPFGLDALLDRLKRLEDLAKCRQEAGDRDPLDDDWEELRRIEDDLRRALEEMEREGAADPDRVADMQRRLREIREHTHPPRE